MAKKLSDIAELASWSTLPRVKFEDLIGKEITIEDISWREGEQGDYAVMKIYVGDESNPSSTACGGVAVVETLKKAVELKALPLICTPQAFPSSNFKGKNVYVLQ